MLTQEVQAWQMQRNDEVVKVLWQFTTNDARTKLKHLYPQIQVWQTTGWGVTLNIY
jgi:hypothetical protein